MFLDVEDVIFVLAADLSIITQGLRDKFDRTAEEAGRNYLDKIVKIQYNIPQMQATDLAALMRRYPIVRAAFAWSEDKPLAEIQASEAFALLRVLPGVGGNIRNVKRILLNFEFSHFLLPEEDQASVDADVAYRLLALTILYQYADPLARAFYTWLADPGNGELTVSSATPQYTEFFTQVSEARGDKTQVRAFFEKFTWKGFTVQEWLGSYVAATMSQISDVSGQQRELTTPLDG